MGSEVRNCSLSTPTATAGSTDAAGSQCLESYSYQQAWVLHVHQESKWRQALEGRMDTRRPFPTAAFSEGTTGLILDTLKWISWISKAYQSNSNWCKKHHLMNFFFKVFYPTKNWKVLSWRIRMDHKVLQRKIRAVWFSGPTLEASERCSYRQTKKW